MLCQVMSGYVSLTVYFRLGQVVSGYFWLGQKRTG